MTNAFMMASSRVVSRMQKGVGDEASRRRVSAGDEEHEEQEAEMRELRGGEVRNGVSAWACYLVDGKTGVGSARYNVVGQTMWWTPTKGFPRAAARVRAALLHTLRHPEMPRSN